MKKKSEKTVWTPPVGPFLCGVCKKEIPPGKKFAVVAITEENLEPIPLEKDGPCELYTLCEWCKADFDLISFEWVEYKEGGRK